MEYERKNIPYDFTEDCIAVMKIYEKRGMAYNDTP